VTARGKQLEGVAVVVGVANEQAAHAADECHQIIDAAASLTMNLEFIVGPDFINAAEPKSPRAAALEDARASIDRIVKLARRIRKARVPSNTQHLQTPRTTRRGR
jgi:hypothetical protein